MEIITSETKGMTTISSVAMKLYFLCEAHRCKYYLGFWNPLKCQDRNDQSDNGDDKIQDSHGKPTFLFSSAKLHLPL